MLLIYILCLSAVLEAAHHSAHNRRPIEPDWEKLLSRRNIHKHNLKELHRTLGSDDVFVLDSPDEHQLSRRNWSVDEQGRAGNNRKYFGKGAAKHGGRGLIGFLVDRTKDLIESSIKTTADTIKRTAVLSEKLIAGTREVIGWVASKTIRIGKLVVEAPLRGVEMTVNTAWALHTFGTGLTAQIISDTADWFQGNWNAVKAMEFPGKKLLVLLYPTGLMSVVNRVTWEIMYIMDNAHKAMSHVFAYTLYLSLKIVFGSVSAAMKLSKLDCITLMPLKVDVNKNLIQTISTKRGKACGISHLRPGNNIKITRNDKKFLVVITPWVLEDLNIHMTGVQVTALGTSILEKEVMDVRIRRVKASGTISFEAGTLLRFVSIHLEVENIEGLNVTFPTKEKSRWMESIESLSDRMSFIVVKEINNVFKKIEAAVFDYIAKF